MQDEFKGPTLDGAICDWLDHGGPFPQYLHIKTRNDSRRHLEILGRDADGTIPALKHARRGKKAFVLQVRDPATGHEMAAKLCIQAEYEDGSLANELDYARELAGGAEFILLPMEVGLVDAFDSQPDSDRWVCILSRWLDGRTLGEIVENSPEMLDPGMVVTIAETMVKAILFFEHKDLKHDDLHLSNVMLVPNELAEIDPHAPPHNLLVIDLGSVKRRRKLTGKRHDDWSNFAGALAQMYNVVHRDRAVASRYPKFLQLLWEYIDALADPELTRHFPQPGDHLRAIRAIRAAIADSPAQAVGFTPFEAISAEHLASDQFLLALFVNHLPWIGMVQTPEPQVLTGPRGCGKSMVFRYLAARTHLAQPADAWATIDRLKFFGVYISCGSDLGSDLLWLARKKGRAAQLANEIVTYFNLVVGRELFRALSAAARHRGVADALNLQPELGPELCEYVQELCQGKLAIMRLAGMDPYQACADALDRMRVQAANAMLHERSAPLALPQTFLRDVCRRLAAAAPGFQTHPVTFLLDDYTGHRLSSDIQGILNTVLWIRDASHVFKVSSEPYGFLASHIDGAKVDAHREYVPIDAGTMTLGADEDVARRTFITDLIDKRLETANYAGRVGSLIGNSESRTDPALAAVIRGERGRRVGNRFYYTGIHVLANAWSGDVATILHMVREMFARSRVGPTTTDRISDKHQHQSIVAVSTALRDRVDGYYPHGPEMSRILKALGDLARKLLVDAPATTPKGSAVIHRKYRMELSLEVGRDLDDEIRQRFPEEGVKLVALRQELVRRAVFIEHAASRGKESAGRRTFRWQLRASLLPSFGTSLVRESYIDVKKVDDFVEFLTDPDEACSKIYRRYADESLPDLFPGAGV